MAVKKPAVREDPQQYVLKKNYKKAAELYRAHIQASPGDTNTYLRLGDCLVLDRDVRGAVDSYKKAARLYADQGFLLKAIAINKKIVKLDPSQEDVHQQLSDQYQERGLLASPVASETRSAPAPGGVAFDMEESTDSVHDLDAGEMEIPELGSELSVDDELLDQVAANEALSALSVDELGDSLADLPSSEDLEDRAEATEAPAGAAVVSDDSVQRTPLFSDFTSVELVEVVKKMVERSFAKGEVVVTEGQPGDALFVIVSGSVRVVTRAGGKELQLAELGEGTFFGEGALLTTRPRTATIIANEDSEMLSLARSALEEIVQTHPRVREVMTQFYQRRAESTVRTILQAKK